MLVYKFILPYNMFTPNLSNTLRQSLFFDLLSFIITEKNSLYISYFMHISTDLNQILSEINYSWHMEMHNRTTCIVNVLLHKNHLTDFQAIVSKSCSE